MDKSLGMFLVASPNQLQILTGVERRRWGEWINKRRSPRVMTAKKAADSLGMTIDELYEAIKFRGEMEGLVSDRISDLS